MRSRSKGTRQGTRDNHSPADQKAEQGHDKCISRRQGVCETVRVLCRQPLEQDNAQGQTARHAELRGHYPPLVWRCLCRPVTCTPRSTLVSAPFLCFLISPTLCRQSLEQGYAQGQAACHAVLRGHYTSFVWRCLCRPVTCRFIFSLSISLSTTCKQDHAHGMLYRAALP